MSQQNPKREIPDMDAKIVITKTKEGISAEMQGTSLELAALALDVLNQVYKAIPDKKSQTTFRYAIIESILSPESPVWSTENNQEGTCVVLPIYAKEDQSDADL